MNPLSLCDAPADNATRTTQKQSRKKTYKNLVWSKGYVKGRSHIRCVARCCVILVKTLLVFLLAQRSNAQRMCEAAFNVYEKGKEKETAFNLIHCFDLQIFQTYQFEKSANRPYLKCQHESCLPKVSQLFYVTQLIPSPNWKSTGRLFQLATWRSNAVCTSNLK